MNASKPSTVFLSDPNRSSTQCQRLYDLPGERPRFAKSFLPIRVDISDFQYAKILARQYSVWACTSLLISPNTESPLQPLRFLVLDFKTHFTCHKTSTIVPTNSDGISQLHNSWLGSRRSPVGSNGRQRMGKPTRVSLCDS